MKLQKRHLRISFLFLAIVFGTRAFPETAHSAEENWVSVSSIPELLSLLWENGGETLSGETLSTWFLLTETTGFQNHTQTEALSPRHCPLSLFFCDAFLSTTARYSIKSTSSFSLNEVVVRNALEDLRSRSRKEPINALFTVTENGSVSAFAPSREGSEIATERSLESIRNALSTSRERAVTVRLPETILPPTVASTDANRLGITQFLGEGRTNFSGSPRNRIFNIKRAIEQFQGILIAPGEEFSFVEHLGEVDGEHGYLPELVIKRGETLPEFGGGICQVSTTLFRAALNTGQEITERRNHAYPVQYYKPYGMDATIYIPKPDFRFRNNTPAHILLQVAIESEKELVFRLYGTHDGRSVSIDGPHITARTPDGGMKTIFTQKVLAANGSTLIEDTFKSSYESASKYPHPGEEKLTQKPKNWSEKQWEAYTKTGALPR